MTAPNVDQPAGPCAIAGPASSNAAPAELRRFINGAGIHPNFDFTRYWWPSSENRPGIAQWVQKKRRPGSDPVFGQAARVDVVLPPAASGEYYTQGEAGRSRRSFGKSSIVLKDIAERLVQGRSCVRSLDHIERIPMPRVFTREEFYDLVWSKPMTHLAKEFAISDVALHKICKKHDIPNPPLGWWAKKAAGKIVKEIPLPKAKVGSPDKIIIAGADLGRESAALAGVREQARIIASEGDDVPVAPPHPIVERTLAKLGKAKPFDIGIVTVDDAGLIKCEVASSSIDRLAVILPRIVQAALLQGFELVASGGTAAFRSETETLGFSITESIRRVKHVMTDAERAKEEAWQRKRDRAVPRNEWSRIHFDKPSFPEWDYHPTGQLSFEFEQVYVSGGSAPRRSFRDAKIQRLENMASDIAVGLAVLAAAKTEQRLKREAEQRRFEEERCRREHAARIKYVEDRRAAGLGAILSELEELERLRRFVATLTAEVSVEAMPRLSTFVAWAREHLAQREARLTVQALEDRFEAGNLFGDKDDHGFTPSRW